MKNPLRIILPFLAFLLLLNASALRREVDLLPYEAPHREPLLKMLSRLSKAVEMVYIDGPRALSEGFEKTFNHD